MTLDEFSKEVPFAIGDKNEEFADCFAGTSYVNMLSFDQVAVDAVTLEPGARNNWHIHHATKGGGHVLMVTAGRGWYQEWGKEPRAIKRGDVVNVPANVKHWHGAAKDSWIQYLLVEADGENYKNELGEPVRAEDYEKLN